MCVSTLVRRRVMAAVYMSLSTLTRHLSRRRLGVSVDPGSYSASFGVRNTGNVQTSFNLSSTCGGQITGCSASLGQITVDPGATDASKRTLHGGKSRRRGKRDAHRILRRQRRGERIGRDQRQRQ